MKRPINRNDVARLAGVAPSTVSNVINGTKFVSDEIKQRVQKAIEELDYQPNLLARSFKMNSTRQISVLVRSLGNFNEIYTGMYEAASAAGYSLSTIIANDEKRNYYQDCYAHRVEGVINLSPFFCDPKEYAKMTEHNMAFVNPAPGIGGFEVSMNYVNAVEAFVEELTRRGKTKIALLADAIRADIEPDTRLIALRYFLEKKGLKFDESLLCCAQEGSVVPEATEFGYRATAHLLEARPDVEALFCMNDYIALGAYKCLNERGIPIPDRISVCGCDNDVMSGYMFPALSTMSVDKADFGRQCVRSILCQLKGEPGERRIILYASYIPRQSV